MKKTFVLRVDAESDKGIREGLPKLLDLLKEYGIKASFYVPLGGESGLFGMLRYRSKLSHSDERKIKLWKLSEKLRVLLFPRDFVARNKKIFDRIIAEGHELGLHGWKHREWTRGLERINISGAIDKSCRKFSKLFNLAPVSFASPAFNINGKVMHALEEHNIKFISDFAGDKPEMHDKIKNVPITITGPNKTPIIEYMVSQGKNDEEILDFLKRESGHHSIVSLYIHDLFEARFKISLLRNIFEFVKKEKMGNKRIIDF